MVWGLGEGDGLGVRGGRWFGGLGEGDGLAG